MNNRSEVKVIATLRVSSIPVRVIETNEQRMIQAKDAGKGAWRAAIESELKLILGASSKARNLLLEKTNAEKT